MSLGGDGPDAGPDQIPPTLPIEALSHSRLDVRTSASLPGTPIELADELVVDVDVHPHSTHDSTLLSPLSLTSLAGLVTDTSVVMP